MAIDRTNKQRKRAFVTTVKRLFTGAILIAALAMLIRFYDYTTTSERFAVKRIDFKGLGRLDKTALEKSIADLRGQNIILLDLKNYSMRIANHPRVRRAAVHRVLPNRVVCAIEEREPVALVFSGEFLEVDDEGMIMPADKLSPLLDLPVISGVRGADIRQGKPCRNPDLLSALEALRLCKRYGGSFANDISEINLGTKGLSIISLREDYVMLLGRTNFKNRLRKYFLMRKTIAERESSAKLIDLRFDDQIVLRSRI